MPQSISELLKTQWRKPDKQPKENNEKSNNKRCGAMLMQTIELVLSGVREGDLNLVKTNKRKPFYYETLLSRSLIIPVPNKLGTILTDFNYRYPRVLEHYNVENLKDIKTYTICTPNSPNFSIKYICRLGNITQI
jgi:hypothetical protein